MLAESGLMLLPGCSSWSWNFENPKAMNKLARLLVISSLILVAGCDQGEDSPQQVEVLDTGASTATETTVQSAPAATTPSSESQSAATSESVVSGQYLLQVGQGVISLEAKESSRQAILGDMAGQLGFELRNPQGLDALISVRLENSPMNSVLESLLAGVPYSARYREDFGNQGFRIAGVVVGEETALLSAVGADETVSEPSIALAASGIPMPPVKGEIYFGSEPDDVELAQRLQFGSSEDRAIAVSELMMDPTGFNAAYLTFLRDPDPEVRLAVLELIEAEENFVAKQMVVASLSDTNKDIVMYALEIVDSMGDFSLVPQIEALYNHYDPEVREYAREIRESLTAGYFEPDE